MKTLKLILLSVTSILLTVSCNNNDDNIEDMSSQKQFESYWYIYGDYPIIVVMPGQDQTVRIKYDSHGNPVKRIGGTSATSNSSGGVYLFNNDFYDELTYGNNNVTIISKLNSTQGTVLENKRYYEFENGRLSKRIIYSSVDPTFNDTILYSYSNDNRLSKSIVRRDGIRAQTNYYYNANKNVDSIVTRRPSFNPVTYTWDFDFTTKGRVKEVFKDYDNYKNPTKKLRIFDELFNRSLSENNYSSYEKNEYDNSGHSISFVERKWTLHYKNNEIDFSQQP